MSASQVWEVTLKGTLMGQACDNVFFYRGLPSADPGDADIGQAVYEQLWPKMRICVSSDYTLEHIEVRNLFSGATPSVTAVGEAGEAGGGNTLGSFESYGFTLGCISTVTRPGSKRFGGVPDDVVTDGVITDGGIIGHLNDLGDQIATALLDTALGIVEWGIPVIVKRILTDGVYHLPTEIGDLVTNLIVEGAASMLVTSQNSRKVGRGI